MTPYTINIKNECTSDRTIVIKSESGIYIYSRDRKDYIKFESGTHYDALYLTKEKFLELYELMTVLKKYINEGDEE